MRILRLTLAALVFVSSSLEVAAQSNTFPASGSVGIGTTTPGTKLDVQGGYVRAQDPGANSGAFIEGANGISYFGNLGVNDVYLGNANNWGYLVVKNGGNVGIGTTSPALGKLHIANPGGPTLVLDDSNNAAAWWLRLNNAGSDFAIGNSENTGDSNIRFTISGAGNVGIGTANPMERLQVAGNISANGGNLHTNRGRLSFSNTAGDVNHTIYNNYTNIDGEGAWDGMKMNVFAGLDVRVGNAAGTAPSSALRIGSNGNIGVGTTNPTHKFSVNGQIRAKEVIVDTGWSDYVFEPGYPLTSLSEVEAHIKAEKHLPGIPSAAQVAQEGISVGEMQAKLLAKIEELTLHQIEQEKRGRAQDKEIDRLRAEVARLAHKELP